MKFTIVKSSNTISKKFSIDDNTGELVKSDGGNLSKAQFATASGFTISDLKDFIESPECTDKTILIPGTTEYENGVILTRALIDKHELEDISTNKVSRTKKDFAYRGGEGFIHLDYDPSTDYELNDGEALSMDELLNTLYEVIPDLKDVPHLWKTSSSSCIESTETMEELRGISGQHVLVHVKDTKDIERSVDVIFKRLWLAGHGYIFVDKTGGMHARTIIDRVVNSPERELFLKADCMPPAYQNVLLETFNEDATPFDTSLIKDLDINEEGRFEQLVNNARDKRANLAKSIRDLYVNKHAEKLGLSKSKLDNCIINKILYTDNIIILHTGVAVTVGELYEKKEQYDGEYCHDPLEPDYGGSTGAGTKGWIDLDNSRIYSHAHGGITYVLEHSQRKSPMELALEVCDLKDHLIMFRTAANEAINMRYMATEIDQFIGILAKQTHMKKASCEKAFKAEYERLKGTTGKTGSLDIDIFGNDAIDEDGNFREEMVQNNLSIPVTVQFPHSKMIGENRHNSDTFENFEFMAKAYSISFMYDVILKIPEITFPIGNIAEGDNKMNASLSRLKSLCVLNGLGKDCVNYNIDMVHKNQVNPVLDWVNSVKWDGNPRMDLVIDNIRIKTYGNSDEEQVNLDFSRAYKHKVMKMWFMQCIAALDGSKRSPLAFNTGIAVPKYEYILVFVGTQGVQKTKFVKSLLPNHLKQYILTGHELDTKDKDSIKIAISHWITELGELDSTFKKSDISSLKAFMSKEDDEIRMPYAATESKFVRRTSFCGSVNDIQFLVDKTGNRRYLPMEVHGLNPLNLISVPRTDEQEEEGVPPQHMSDDYQNQQLWAECLHYYLSGEQWWPDVELERMLDTVTKSHERLDVVAESIQGKFDFSWDDKRATDKSLIRIKRGEGITPIGEAIKFVYLNATEICNELDLKVDDMTVGKVSGFLSSNGIRNDKKRDGEGNSRRCFRLCLNRGQQLKSAFNANLRKT